jgi:two-component system, OmpR family, phosphate regulon sensor histidine kinase PhoR
LSRPAWQHLDLDHRRAAAVAARSAGPSTARCCFLAVTLAAALAYEVRNLLRFERWLRRRTTEAPPNMEGLWGEVLAITSRIYRRKVFHKRRVLVLLREFRRMTSAMPDGAVLLGQNREILWFNRTAGRWLDLKRKVDYGIRIDNLVRNPDFVEYLDKRGATAPPRIHLPKQRRPLAAGAAGDHQRHGPAAAHPARRHERGPARVHAQGLRGQCLARAALAAHRDRRLPRRAGGRAGARCHAWQGPVQEMRRQSDRMRSIVQDLLELSRLEAHGGEAEAGEVDVGGMLALIRKDALARPQHPATVELHLDSNALLQGSESELHSIFSNLVSNAVKYTPADGRVDIRWWTDARAATSRSATPASASRPSTCRASPSGSTGWMPAARASSAARASGSRL